MQENYIDWSKIKDLNDVLKLDKNILYDGSRAKDPVDMIALNPNLTAEEREDAMFWKDYLSGLMLVTGEKGGGKGVFMHMLAKKMNYYFHKTVISDTRPREAFGECTPFSFPMLVEMLDRIDEVEKGIPHPITVGDLKKSDFDDKESYEAYKELSEKEKLIVLSHRNLIPPECSFKEYDGTNWVFIPNFKPHIDDDTGEWLSARGKVFFVNSVSLFDEFGAKYAPRSKPNLTTSVLLSNLANVTRHLRCLMLGVGVTLDDFAYWALDKATWEAKCVQVDNRNYRFSDNPNDLVFKCYLDNIKFNPVTGSVQKSLGKTQVLLINGSEPRHMLGGGNLISIYNTENAQGMLIPRSVRRIQ